MATPRRPRRRSISASPRPASRRSRALKRRSDRQDAKDARAWSPQISRLSHLAVVASWRFSLLQRLFLQPARRYRLPFHEPRSPGGNDLSVEHSRPKARHAPAHILAPLNRAPRVGPGPRVRLGRHDAGRELRDPWPRSPPGSGPGGRGDTFGTPSGDDGGAFTLPALGDGGGNVQCNSAHKCDDFPSTALLDPLASPSATPRRCSALRAPARRRMVHASPSPRTRRSIRRTGCAPASTGRAIELADRLRGPGAPRRRDQRPRRLHDQQLLRARRVALGHDCQGAARRRGRAVGRPSRRRVAHLHGARRRARVAERGHRQLGDHGHAPAIADGALVYWTTADFDNSATNTTLQGFHVGDEGTTAALTSSQVAQTVRAEPIDGGNLTPQFQQVFCIGCHSATPDGKYVSFTAQWPWRMPWRAFESGSTGARPSWLSNGAVQNLSPDMKDQYSTYYAPPAVDQVMLGVSTFSPVHYQTGDRVLVSSIGASWNSTSLTDPGAATGVVSQLAWFDLEWNNAVTTAGGVVDAGLPVATPCNMAKRRPGCRAFRRRRPTAAGGSSSAPATPTARARRAGATTSTAIPDFIAYSSTNVGTKDGRMDCSTSASCTSDVYLRARTAPARRRAGGAGGMAKPLSRRRETRSTTSTIQRGRPTTSSSRITASPTARGLDQPKAEVYVIPFARRPGRDAGRRDRTVPPTGVHQPVRRGRREHVAQVGTGTRAPGTESGDLPLAAGRYDGEHVLLDHVLVNPESPRGDQRDDEPTEAATLRRRASSSTSRGGPPVRANLSLESELPGE